MDCYQNEGLDWIKVSSMNIARSHFTLNTVGNNILAVGGKTYPYPK